MKGRTKRVVTATSVAWVAQTGVALADNCGSPSDCFFSQRAAILALIAIATIAAFVIGGPGAAFATFFIASDVATAVTERDPLTWEKTPRWVGALGMIDPTPGNIGARGGRRLAKEAAEEIAEKAGERVVREGAEEATEEVAQRSVPHGFRSADDFSSFGQDLNSGLRAAGYDDATALFQGSAVTGKSYRTNAPFDVGRVSDFDIAIASPTALARAQELGIGLRSGGLRTGPLTPAQVERLGLGDLTEALSQQAGRPVNFMLFESTDAAIARAPSIVVP